MLRTFDILGGDPNDTLDLYFRQCAIAVDCRDVSLMAATLANSGVNPLTGEQALSGPLVDRVLSVMTTCGMYDYAGGWVVGVGMPAKSGVGGGVMAVLPGQLGVCVFSPRLDEVGNSVRGVAVCTRLSEELDLHFVDVARSSRSIVRASYDLAGVPSSRRRPGGEREALRQAGRRCRIYELQGDMVFAAIEGVIREIVGQADHVDLVIVDLRAVSRLESYGRSLFEGLGTRLREGGKELVIVDDRERISGGSHIPFYELDPPASGARASYWTRSARPAQRTTGSSCAPISSARASARSSSSAWSSYSPRARSSPGRRSSRPEILLRRSSC